MKSTSTLRLLVIKSYTFSLEVGKTLDRLFSSTDISRIPDYFPSSVHTWKLVDDYISIIISYTISYRLSNTHSKCVFKKSLHDENV